MRPSRQRFKGTGPPLNARRTSQDVPQLSLDLRLSRYVKLAPSESTIQVYRTNKLQRKEEIAEGQLRIPRGCASRELRLGRSESYSYIFLLMP